MKGPGVDHPALSSCAGVCKVCYGGENKVEQAEEKPAATTDYILYIQSNIHKRILFCMCIVYKRDRERTRTARDGYRVVI